MYGKGDRVRFTRDGEEKVGVVMYIDYSDHRARNGELVNILVPEENCLYKEVPEGDVWPVSGENA